MQTMRTLKRTIVAFMCIALTPTMIVLASEQERQMAKAVDYFQEIVAFVVKEDAKALYLRMTPAVKAKLSERDIAVFLHKFLNGLGAPKGMSITGFDVDPKNEFCQIKGHLNYEKEDLVLSTIMKVVGDGFQIQYLHLGFPNSKSRLEKLAQRPKKFLNEKFFPTLQNQGVDKALDLVDMQVRQQVGDDLIKAILRSLRKTTIKSIKSYNVNNGPQGKIHQFLLLGQYNGTPCEVQIYLKSKGDRFTVMDVNLQLLKES